MRKYFLIFCLSFKTGLLRYKELLGLAVFLVSCITVFAVIWQESTLKLKGYSFSPVDFVWYVALNEWVLLSLPDCFLKVSEDYKSGLFSYHLIRPVSYIACKFSEALGELMASLILLAPVAFLTAWGWTRCCPLSAFEISLSLGFGLIGGILGILAFLAVGFCRFWFDDVVPVYWIFEKFLFLCGGLFLPLQVYPEWLQPLVFVMPSFGILGGRSALVFDSSWLYILFLSASCLIWGVFFYALSHLMMKKGTKSLLQEGG